MHFPILTSLVALPIAGALLLLFVPNDEHNDGTVRAVAQMGYQVVEFYGPYFEWSEAQAKDMRQLMDELHIRCLSTHNDEDNFIDAKIEHTKALNLILGSKYVVRAWSDPKPNIEEWKELAAKLNAASDKLAPAGLKVGYHNHDAEWKAVEGKRPIEILAANTKPEVMLQLDVGTCLEAGADPVAWIQANPGRIRSIHCKDWSPDPSVGYKTLFGEGKAWAGSNTTWSSRKAADFRNWRQPAAAWRHSARCTWEARRRPSVEDLGIPAHGSADGAISGRL